jgi:hypothetical protein
MGEAKRRLERTGMTFRPNIMMVDFLEGRRPYIEKIWNFLGQKFGMDFPFPNVRIFLAKDNYWKKYLDFNRKLSLSRRLELMNNEEEKQLVSKNKGWNGQVEEPDAGLSLPLPENKEAFEELGNPDWIIEMADNRCYLPKNAQRNNLIPIIGFDYYYFLILHEFIHIYERLSGKQLQQGNTDLSLMNEFMGWNYQIVNLGQASQKPNETHTRGASLPYMR